MPGLTLLVDPRVRQFQRLDQRQEVVGPEGAALLPVVLVVIVRPRDGHVVHDAVLGLVLLHGGLDRAEADGAHGGG